ncbi:cell division protein ZapE [Microbacterium stercoris]|uniref:Cell division protein ZapE n=1 Tax=Microbacterium stercoris TaxID=2820289 RepID=A0A939QU21_9MICO|nr:cell division protein ZapE [Microbacterium stercoris]MBO3664676.1 cell division protein ZapE [Microbacterium stercoris]
MSSPAAALRPVFPGLTERAFEEAAGACGFELGAAQRGAVRVLAAPERRNLYLHGPAGRGKTWLMDVAFASADTEHKRRVHFHDFFPALHAAIFRHHHRLDAALDELVGDLELLCFDEFHVHDVADGVLVRRLLSALAERDIATVLTSNYSPESLLPDPRFHGSFLPAIAEIRERFEVVRVDDGADHRESGLARGGFASGRWIAGDTSGADDESELIRIGDRDVEIGALTAGELRATFAQLCERPLGASDYARLADRAGRWQLTRIPPLETVSAPAAQRFANLVDVAADRGVTIRFGASGSFERLADAPVPPLDLPRTLSRLRSLRGAD